MQYPTLKHRPFDKTAVLPCFIHHTIMTLMLMSRDFSACYADHKTTVLPKRSSVNNNRNTNRRFHQETVNEILVLVKSTGYLSIYLTSSKMYCVTFVQTNVDVLRVL